MNDIRQKQEAEDIYALPLSEFGSVEFLETALSNREYGRLKNTRLSTQIALFEILREQSMTVSDLVVLLGRRPDAMQVFGPEGSKSRQLFSKLLEVCGIKTATPQSKPVKLSSQAKDILEAITKKNKSDK